MRLFYLMFFPLLFVSCVSLKKTDVSNQSQKKSGSAIPGNEFQSGIAGFKVQKPEKWHFVTAEEYTDNLEKVKLDDKVLQEKLRQYATLPLVAIMKYKEPYDDVNPSFKVNIRPLGPIDGSEPVKIIDLILPALKQMFPDLKVKSKKNTSIAGLKAGYSWFEYTMKLSDGKMFPISSEIWVVPRGKYFFLLGSGTKIGDESARKEIQNIIKTVEFI